LGDDRNAFLGEELLYNKRCVARCVSLVVQQFLAEKNIPVITQPSYSPDLAPSDFWLFPTLKMELKETRFVTLEDIKSNTVQPKSGRLQKKPSAGTSNNGRIEGASVCVRARVLL
jgi:hypothetical protein